jgi:hypothetical protein
MAWVACFPFHHWTVLLKRIRDKAYLIYVRSFPCLVCKQPAGAAHHILFAQPRARGMKVGDNWTIPLCHQHHEGVHHYGNEKAHWARVGVDVMKWAKENYDEYLGNFGDRSAVSTLQGQAGEHEMFPVPRDGKD